MFSLTNFHSVAAKVVRSRSAVILAPSAEVSGRITRKRSSPRRPRTSDERRPARWGNTTWPMWRMIASPTSGPTSSLMALKSSRSRKRSENVLPYRFERSSSIRISSMVRWNVLLPLRGSRVGGSGCSWYWGRLPRVPATNRATVFVSTACPDSRTWVLSRRYASAAESGRRLGLGCRRRLTIFDNPLSMTAVP